MPVKFAARDQDIPMEELEVHPVYSKRFDSINGHQWEQFVESMRVGQQEPIAVTKTKTGYQIIDGYQRWRAAVALGWSMIKADILSGSWATTDEKEQIRFCDDMNQHRRHLTFSAKAKEYKKKSKSSGGRPKTAGKVKKKTGAGSAPVSASEAATQAGYTSERLAQEDQALFDATIPEVHSALDARKITKKQAKEISQLDKSEQLAALNRALADEPIDEPAPEAHVLDELGGAVPENLYHIFEQTSEWKSAMQHISQAKGIAAKLGEQSAGAWLDKQELERCLDQARVLLKFSMPYTECVKCRRKPTKQCVHCRGKGWLTKSAFSECASDSDKSWLEKRQ